MEHHPLEPEHKHKKRVPLWKWILIILLVIALPLFFSFYRSMQIQQVLNEVPAGKNQ